MSTKNNPGAFDCYADAAPDEPMFVLLGRDRHAPALIRAWALLRQRAGEDEAKIAEALQCADAMEEHRRGGGSYGLCQTHPHEYGAVNRMLAAVSEGLDAHPDDYEDVCDCNECRSYG